MANLRISGGAKRIVSVVFAGGISAALFVFAGMRAMAESSIGNLYLAAVILVLTPVPLFMAGLGAGVTAAVTASVVAIAALLVMMPSHISVLFGILAVIPAIVLTTLALRHQEVDEKTGWYSESLLLTAVTLYAITLFIVFDLLPTQNPQGLLGLTIDHFHQMAGAMPASPVAQFFKDYADYIASLMPFFAALCIIALIAISFVLAQGILVKTQLNIRPALDLRSLKMPRWMAPAVGLGLLATILGGVQAAYVGKNVSLIFCIPFFCQGLAVIHAYAATTKAQLLVLIAFYVILSALIWFVFVVALLGIADQWVDFRRRWNQPQLPV